MANGPTPFVRDKGKFGPMTYRRIQDGTRVWGRIDSVFADGREVAQVASAARSSMLFGEDEVQVKVDNRLFYDGQWSKVLDTLLLGEGWLYTATSQLDLAADGVGFLAPFDRYVKGGIEYGGKAALHFEKKPNRPVSAFRLGSRQSGKYARCYYKREELAVSGKTYIADYWHANGVPADAAMERLEVSMKGGEIRRYFGGDLADHHGEVVGHLDERSPQFLSALRDPATRVQMYHSAMRKFVDFREVGPELRARDKRRLLQWDYSSVAAGDVVPVERAPRLHDFGLNTIKVMIKGNYVCGKASGGGGGGLFMQAAQMQVAAFGLEKWYAERRDAWDVYYAKLIKAGGLTARTLFDKVRLTRGD
jgi:hypothetical protein